MTILKYAVARSCVSEVEPQNLMTSPANVTSTVPMSIAAMMIKRIPDTSIRLASSFLSSPRLLATRADSATFTAKNNDSPMNFGCVVRPIAATALLPRLLTIYESTSPTKAVKNDSTTAGHAIFIVSLNSLLSDVIIFIPGIVFFFHKFRIAVLGDYFSFGTVHKTKVRIVHIVDHFRFCRKGSFSRTVLA